MKKRRRDNEIRSTDWNAWANNRYVPRTHGVSGLLRQSGDDRAGGGGVVGVAGLPLGQTERRVVPLDGPPVHALLERTLPHVQAVVRRQRCNEGWAVKCD